MRRPGSVMKRVAAAFGCFNLTMFVQAAASQSSSTDPATRPELRRNARGAGYRGILTVPVASDWCMLGVWLAQTLTSMKRPVPRSCGAIG